MLILMIMVIGICLSLEGLIKFITDICFLLARRSLLKLIPDIDFKQGLKEANIKSYLIKDAYVPKILGLIEGPKKRNVFVKPGKTTGKSYKMTVQQFCAKGETCIIQSILLSVLLAQRT